MPARMASAGSCRKVHMNVVNFNERTCEKYRRYFDAHLDDELAEALRNRFRTERRSFFAHSTAGWMMAAAALLVLAIGGIAALQRSSAIQLHGDDGAFWAISVRLQGILRVGLVDHVHC